MSIRGIWVLSIQRTNTKEEQVVKTLFSKIYPTVEKRAKLCEGAKYVSLPDHRTFVDVLIGHLGFRTRPGHFVASRDSCQIVEEKPVFGVDTVYGKLWPVLVIEQHGLLFCCLPLVEEGSHMKPPLIKIKGLTAGFSLLLGMADFLKDLPVGVDETHPKCAELYYFVNQAAPFGTPKDTNHATIRALMTKPAMPASQRQPAWKPSQYKGKASLYFAATEQIRAVLYGDVKAPDIWDVYGNVICSAELEGAMTEVTLNMYKASPATRMTPLESVIVHPCVLSTDSYIGSTTTPKWKLRFSPPNEMFILCHYSAKVSELPIKGFYQMKGDSTVNILVQLKLNESLKNSFSHCFVNLPFFHRGAIVKHESNASQGNVNVSQSDPRTLVWNIGQKFSSKTLEVTLKSTVYFDPSNLGKKTGHHYDEPFCVENNSYIQVFFKVTDFTLSRYSVDQKSVQISPNSKVKVTSVAEFQTTDYKIWNSHGDAIVGFPPPKFIT